MSHNGYASTEFDAETNMFHGTMLNLRDVITFQGFPVAAKRAGLSFNKWVAQTLERSTG